MPRAPVTGQPPCPAQAARRKQLFRASPKQGFGADGQTDTQAHLVPIGTTLVTFRAVSTERVEVRKRASSRRAQACHHRNGGSPTVGVSQPPCAALPHPRPRPRGPALTAWWTPASDWPSCALACLSHRELDIVRSRPPQHPTWTLPPGLGERGLQVSESRLPGF